MHKGTLGGAGHRRQKTGSQNQSLRAGGEKLEVRERREAAECEKTEGEGKIKTSQEYPLKL